MGGMRLQADQFLDGLVGLPLGTSLQVLPQEDQRHDQGRRIIEGDVAQTLGQEGRDHAHAHRRQSSQARPAYPYWHCRGAAF